MKKIYVMAAFLGATSFAFNQVIQKAPVQISKNTDRALSTNNNVEKASGTVLETFDFSSPANWTIGGDGAQGTWVIGTESDYTPFTFQSQSVTLSNFMNDPGMTTFANNYAFFDAIQYNDNGLVQNAWVEMANVVDCSGENTVTFKFEQEYRAFNTDFTYVEVSLDAGATWVQATDINPTIPANANATETLVYRNFDVNGSADVKFRFRWEAGAGATGGGYGWLVDDIEISTLADHDLAVTNQVYGTTNEGSTIYYHQIPLVQVAPIEGSAIVKNQGSQDQTNVVFSASETVNGTYMSASVATGLVAGASDSLVLATNFTPSALGNYNIDYVLAYDNNDDVPSNNTFRTYKFSVEEHIYARDSSTTAQNGTVYGSLSGSNQTPPEVIEPANLFDIFTTADLTGVDFQFGSSIAVGSEVFGQIYDANFDPVAGGETLPYETQAGDEGNYVSLVFDTPVNLAPGEYLISVKCFETDFSVASAGASPVQTSFVYYPSETTWYYTTSTPVIRMNFDPTLSIENNELSNLNVSQNFPNPFANETTVMFNLKEASDVSYTVVDLTGKVVANGDKGTTVAGEHEITIDGTSFANGVYYLNINAGDSKVTRKMIVNK
jgi:hypothetical protein